MKATIYFGIELPYEITRYDLLTKLRLGKKGKLWIFPIEKYKQVKELVNFEYDEKYKDVFVPEWKGKSGYEVEPCETMYLVKHWKKDEHGVPKQSVHKVTIESVNKLWQVIQKQPLNKKIKTKTVAKNICAVLGITRFVHSSGAFDFAKLFGNRQDYFRIFYYPLKVLVWQSNVHHYKSGHVERLK